MREDPDKKPKEDGDVTRHTFADGEDIERAKRVPGTIFMEEVDLSHPLAYGLGQTTLPVFRSGKLLLELTDSPYQTPLVYAEEPLAAGYLPEGEADRVARQAAAVVAPLGKGRVIAMTDDLVFRGYWFGSMRLLGNTVF
ncbi:MAG: hypothetical protein J6386_04670 [Candidatus Synoicihabitans palmerolidicus]|nr:hypothetical protein [Candidatus Synoicihabitans palmerolidicus]MCC5022126.1 hypothetical protein [Candidatus Synoicihabitans palmerolidicus]